MKGVELEVAARIRERLTFNLAFTSIDSEVTKTSGTDLGNELVAVPDMLLSALVDYTFQEGPLGGFGFGLGFRHRGELFGDGANQFKSDSVTMYDAILHYDTSELALRVERQQLHRRDLRRSMQQHFELFLRDAATGHGQRDAQVLIAMTVRATLLTLALGALRPRRRRARRPAAVRSHPALRRADRAPAAVGGRAPGSRASSRASARRRRAASSGSSR